MQVKHIEMTANAPYTFYLLDDDPVNLMLLQKVIEITGLSSEIVKFTSGHDLLKHIKETPEEKESITHTFIIADNDMPQISGVEFIQQFEEFSVSKKLRYRIFMNTAGLSRRLIEKMKELPSLIYEFVKPLTSEHIKTLVMIAENKS